MEEEVMGELYDKVVIKRGAKDRAVEKLFGLFGEGSVWRGDLEALDVVVELHLNVVVLSYNRLVIRIKNGAQGYIVESDDTGRQGNVEYVGDESGLIEVLVALL